MLRGIEELFGPCSGASFESTFFLLHLKNIIIFLFI